MASSNHNIDVIFDSSTKNTPSCPHGPTLLFERYVKGAGCRRFFACAAFRDRKQCSFFRWEDDIKNRSKDSCPQGGGDGKEKSLVSHTALRKRFLKFKRLPRESRSVCCTCGVLLLPEELPEHADQTSHTVKHRVSIRDLHHPTTLFTPQEDNKTFAQYLFTDSAVDFVLSSLENLEFSHVLCVGAPRIHEAVTTKHKNGQTPLTSLLLDLDSRYAQVYSCKRMCLYNMFNHHFFDPHGEGNFKCFLGEGGKGVVLVTDPPFGGMVEALVATFRKIEETWKKLTETDASLPILWFFPYFMEKRISDCMPSLAMLDYKVDYENHTLFNTKDRKKKKGSPVRVFTNITPSCLPLPATDGYWYCEVCERYSAPENKHCVKCQSCTSKDGTTYRHCDLCNRCVKPSRVHCSTCGVCDLPLHICGKSLGNGCHICGSLDHKRRECPQKFQSAKQSGKKRKPSKVLGPSDSKKQKRQ